MDPGDGPEIGTVIFDTNMTDLPWFSDHGRFFVLPGRSCGKQTDKMYKIFNSKTKSFSELEFLGLCAIMIYVKLRPICAHPELVQGNG